MTAIKFSLTSERLCDLIDEYEKSIFIPLHQRPFIWSKKQQMNFVETVVSNFPFPPLILSETYDGIRRRWIEDGQQRFMTLRKFIKGLSNDGGILKFHDKTFAELSVNEQCKVLNYPVGIQQYWNASVDERERLFDLFQNGTALTTGQRYWHHSRKSPMVIFAIQNLMSSSSIYFKQTKSIWGVKDVKTDGKTKLDLTKSMSFACAVAFGVNYITRSFETIAPMLEMSFDDSVAHTRLAFLINTVSDISATGGFKPVQKKKFWCMGTIAGYILYAYLMDIQIDWIDFIRRCNDYEEVMRIIHDNKLKSRNWKSQRWKQGIENVQAYLEGTLVPSINIEANDS